MAFPQDRLNTRVELQLSGTWTDITTYVYGRDGGGISITRGRSDEGSRVDPGRCTMQLDNRDGRFSPRNPRGTYYGQIGRNTPIRVSVDPGSDVALFLPGAASGSAAGYVTTPDHASLDITGDIDIRLEATLDTWWAAGTIELAGKWGAAGQRSWWLGMRDELLYFEWSADGTTTLSATSTEIPTAVPSHRLAVRVTLDVDNGAAGKTVTFYTSDGISGTWTQLGSAVTTSGTTSIFNSTAAVEVGDVASLAYSGAAGRVHALELRNGIAGSVVANPTFSSVASGSTSFADGAGRTWSTGGNAEITGRRTRFVGEVSSWPPRWGNRYDVYTPIEACGLLRRLGQGSAPLDSALFRAISTDDDVLAYWPLEDEASATMASSPIEGVRSAMARGITFAADDSLDGSKALPTLATGGYVKGRVPAGSGTGWHVELVYKLSALPASITSVWQVHLSGSRIQRALVRTSTSAIRIELRDDEDAVITSTEATSSDAINGFIGGEWNRLQVRCTDTGTDVEVTATWLRVASSDSWSVSATATSTAPGIVTWVDSGAVASAYNGMAVGHVAVFDTSSTSVYADAVTGFAGETALTRIVRLTGEEGIGAVHSYDGDTTVDSEAMGPQRPAAFLDLINQCADADGGILYERVTRATLAYRDRATLYNQNTALTLDYTASGLVTPLDPVDDDQHTRNDVTVQRDGGSSARAELAEGDLSVLDPPDGVGRYADSLTLTLHDDAQPERIAWWRLHLGTWDEARYPQVSVNLAANTALIGAATTADIGDVLRITNPPNWLPAGPIDLMVQGINEEIRQFEWGVTYNCTPAGPWRVGIVTPSSPASTDPPNHFDTDGSSLAAAIGTTDTTVYVIATDGPEWVTTAGPSSTAAANDLPVTVTVGGEEMSATAIQPRSWDQFTRTVSNTWSTSTSGDAWTEVGGSASDRSVSGTQGVITLASSPSTTRFQHIDGDLGDCEVTVAITPSQLATGDSFLPSILLRYTDSSNYYRCRLVLATSGAVSLQVTRDTTVIGSTATTLATYGAGTKLWLRARVDGHRVRGRVWADGASEPGTWMVDQTVSTSTIATGRVGVTASAFAGNTNVNPQFSYDDFRIRRPQKFTVTRSTNGIVKSHASGADVRLAEPMIFAL